MNLQDLFRQLFNHPRTLKDLGITEERCKQIMSATIDAWREPLQNPFAFACFDSRRHDRDTSPSPAAHGDARGGFGSGRHNGDSTPSTDSSGGADRGFERDRVDPEERGRIWKKTDFPTDEALRQCRVKQHEDLLRHIYLLLDILGLQFQWLLTRVGIGRTIVSAEERGNAESRASHTFWPHNSVPTRGLEKMARASVQSDHSFLRR